MNLYDVQYAFVGSSSCGFQACIGSNLHASTMIVVNPHSTKRKLFCHHCYYLERFTNVVNRRVPCLTRSKWEFIASIPRASLSFSNFLPLAFDWSKFINFLNPVSVLGISQRWHNLQILRNLFLHQPIHPTPSFFNYKEGANCSVPNYFILQSYSLIDSQRS